jgi:pyruvate kinase
MSRRAKIVCTLGPATSSQEQITALISAGMDVARLNMSHGSQADHLTSYQRVRAGSDITGRAVGILADLQGPKIRLGDFPDGPFRLAAGDEFTITTAHVPGDRNMGSTTYQGLADDVRIGDRILIDDGNVQLEVIGVTGDRVRTRTIVGGKISNHKGINLPGVKVSTPALTEKDEPDLRWALATGADMIAMSFVRSPDDAQLARKIINDSGRTGVPLIAKIEKPEAVEFLADIVDAFDGIMVARGDLGVE